MFIWFLDYRYCPQLVLIWHPGNAILYALFCTDIVPPFPHRSSSHISQSLKEWKKMDQSSRYVWQWKKRRSEPCSTTSAVHFLFSLDTVQSVIVMDDLFYWFVYHFNDYRTFSHFNFSLIDGPFLDSIIMFTVQTVYCWRVWRLGGWRVIPAVIALVSIFQHWSRDSEVELLVYSLCSFPVSVGYLWAFMWISSLFSSYWLTSHRVWSWIRPSLGRLNGLKRSVFSVQVNDVPDEAIYPAVAIGGCRGWYHNRMFYGFSGMLYPHPSDLLRSSHFGSSQNFDKRNQPVLPWSCWSVFYCWHWRRMLLPVHRLVAVSFQKCWLYLIQP